MPKKPLGIMGPVLFLVACGATEIETGLNTFTESLDAAKAPLEPVLRQGVEAETAQAKATMIADGGLVYERPLGCVSLVFGPQDGGSVLDKASRACALESNFSPTLDRGSSAYAADGFAALTAYAGVLEDLNSATVSADTAAGFSSFLTSLNSFAEIANPNAGGDPNKIIRTERIAPLGNLVGRAVEARRVSILRRLVNAAHPEVKKVIAELIAFRERDEGLVGKAEALSNAYGDMTTAQNTGSDAAYASAVEDYETEFESFQTALKNSDTGRLMALWKAHQLMHAQVNSTGDIENLVGLLEDFKALTDA